MSKPVSLCDYVQFSTSFEMMKLKGTWKRRTYNLRKRIIWFIKELDRTNTRKQLYLQLTINLIQNLLPPTKILCTDLDDLQSD